MTYIKEYLEDKEWMYLHLSMIDFKPYRLMSTTIGWNYFMDLHHGSLNLLTWLEPTVVDLVNRFYILVLLYATSL